MDTDLRDAVEAGFVEAYSDHQEALLALGRITEARNFRRVAGMGEARRRDRTETGPEPRASQGAVVMNLCHACKKRPPHWKDCSGCVGRCASCCSGRNFECDLHLTNCDTIAHCRQRMDAWVKRNLLA